MENENVTNYDRYFQYLQQRSLIGLLYRKLWLYPKLTRYLKGEALDVGCGIGDLLSFRPNTVGVDINPKMVEWCKSNGLEVQLMEEDRLSFGGQTFDSIIMDNVLEHIEEPGPILSEVHRVLKKKGILIVGVPGILGYSRDIDHKIYYSKEKIVETVSTYGFLVRKIFTMPFDQSWFESKLAQCCIYSVFQREGDDE